MGSGTIWLKSAHRLNVRSVSVPEQSMNALLADLMTLGPHHECMDGAKSWEGVTRKLGKELDMTSRYTIHGPTLVRAMRAAKGLKGIFRRQFPEAAAALDQQFSTDNPSMQQPQTFQSTMLPMSAATASQQLPVVQHTVEKRPPGNWACTKTTESDWPPMSATTGAPQSQAVQNTIGKRPPGIFVNCTQATENKQMPVSATTGAQQSTMVWNTVEKMQPGNCVSKPTTEYDRSYAQWLSGEGDGPIDHPPAEWIGNVIRRFGTGPYPSGPVKRFKTA